MRILYISETNISNLLRYKLIIFEIDKKKSMECTSRIFSVEVLNNSVQCTLKIK